jgi:2'-5' RNA ligase
MVKERTIMIFPQFENIEIINEIRKKYDPLADKVLPHITLVFPFKSELSNNEITEWLYKSMKEVKPFHLKMEGFSKQEDGFGNYLFLNVIEGKEKIINLHKALYKGILEEFKMNYPYEPHMTVGRLQIKEEMDSAFKNLGNYINIFETIVDNISVEMIGENEESIIEIEYKLQE